jgi:hypothetical protein
VTLSAVSPEISPLVEKYINADNRVLTGVGNASNNTFQALATTPAVAKTQDTMLSSNIVTDPKTGEVTKVAATPSQELQNAKAHYDKLVAVGTPAALGIAQSVYNQYGGFKGLADGGLVATKPQYGLADRLKDKRAEKRKLMKGSKDGR